MKHVFIINPVAGKNDHVDEVVGKVRRAFSGHPEYGRPVIEFTKGPGDATRIAKEYAAKATQNEPMRLYACGGDGTLCEVFNGMVGNKHCTLACMPYGSGNDFIKAFGKDSAADFLDLNQQLEGTPCNVDYLKTNDIVSLNITTVGFDAGVCMSMNRYRNLPLVSGKGRYVIAVAERFMRSFKHTYTFVLDGVKQPKGNYMFGVAANGRYYGGTFHPAPYADLQDGLIDFVTVPTVSKPVFVQLVGAYSKGTHFEKSPLVRLRRVKKVQILAPEPIPVNIDGEVMLMKNPTVEIVPQGVSFLVPKKLLLDYELQRPLLAEQAKVYLERSK